MMSQKIKNIVLKKVVIRPSNSVNVLLLTVAARGGYSLIAVHGLLIVVAFLVAEHGR